MSEPTPATAPADATASGKGSSMILTLLCILNLGGTGFIAFRALKPLPVKIESAAEPKREPEQPPAVTTLDPFVVNLNETGSSRYLKTTLELELKSDKVVEEITRDKRIVRDEILRYLSGLTVKDTLGEENKTKIQGEIVARVNKSIGGEGEKVRRMFFTEFVVQ